MPVQLSQFLPGNWAKPPPFFTFPPPYQLNRRQPEKPSWETKARRQFGCNATYHDGNGQFAFITTRRVGHYSMWAYRQAPEKRKAFSGKTGCCGGCLPRRHYLINLENAK
jgi:hypothetical protein